MTIDHRKQVLDTWVSEQLGAAVVGEAASSDAFFRRYFRYAMNEKTFIAMDAPPQHGECKTFVARARLLASADIHVPDVLAENHHQGFLLLSDLGKFFLETTQE